MKLNLDYQGYVNTVVGTRINQGGNNIVCMSGCIEMQMGSQICSVVSRGAFSSCCYRLQPRKSANKFGNLYLTKCTSPSGIGETPHGSCFFRRLPKIKLNVGAVSWPQCASADSMFDADRTHTNDYKEDNSDLSYSHGKKVQTNYSIIGIPEDGRCLFRSVAHGACLRAGKSAPSESLQKKLADNLRARVADEFIKRREETEWFIEGDFDTYISQIRKPHVWGGEPELLMASHVLLMPITVYMHDEKADGLISIAEYGQEYGKENPIRVLYNGFGHYDALHIPGVRD